MNKNNKNRYAEENKNNERELRKNKNEIKVVEEILEHFFCTCRLIMCKNENSNINRFKEGHSE